MGFIEELLVTQYMRVDREVHPLCIQGFTPKEAENLDYLVSRYHSTRLYGFGLGGLLTLVFGFRYLRQPQRLRQSSDLLFSVISLPVCMFSFNYYGKYNRKASNTYFGNLYSNNLLNQNKNALVSNFFKFNRKFTQEEIEQFKFNKLLQERGRKKYHYNPLIHGDNEEIHREKHQAYNDGRHYLPQQLCDKIQRQNADKTANGEVVRLKPFLINKHLDHTGLMFKAKYFNLRKKHSL